MAKLNATRLAHKKELSCRRDGIVRGALRPLYNYMHLFGFPVLSRDLIYGKTL